MIRLFSATLLSLLLCASLANAAEKPLIVASDATWPPIEMLDENKNVVGYSIDYLKAVAKEAGLNVEFRNTAWDGIFAALESRQADIIASSVTITDKRKKAMGFSDPYCEIRQAVVVSTNSDLKNLKELDGKKVGGQIGTTGLVETLPKAKSKAIVKTYDEVGLALEDLAKGNIDAVICDDPVAKFYANKKQEYAGKLKVAFITDDVEFYGFAVRKSDTDLVKKLNEGIKAVKEKGIDKQVVEKWIGKSAAVTLILNRPVAILYRQGSPLPCRPFGKAPVFARRPGAPQLARPTSRRTHLMRRLPEPDTF